MPNERARVPSPPARRPAPARTPATRPEGHSGNTLPSNGTGTQERPPLDFAILCERFREVPGGFGFDPRRSPEAIARRLNVSPATVRRRLTEWRNRGFFLGYDVLPHPGLLGGRLVARLLDFSDAVAQEGALRPLSLMDGVVQIVPSRTMLMVAYLVDSESQSARRWLQLRELSGSAEVGAEMPFSFPPCSRRMSRADWRLVRALRRAPEAKLAALAEEVGQSPRTTSHRVDALLETGAIVFDPILDFSRFSTTLASVVAFLDDPTSAGRVEALVRALSPHSEPRGGPSPTDPEGRPRTAQFLVCARTAAELDSLAARVAHIEGVQRVLLWYERSSLPVRGWLNERIESILTQGADV